MGVCQRTFSPVSTFHEMGRARFASMPLADFDQSHAAMPGMTPARTGLFAIAAGLAVGNLYLG